MRTILFIFMFIFVIAYWTQVSNFVSGNFSTVGATVAQWLVDHTPKK